MEEHVTNGRVPSPGDWVLIKWGGKISGAHAVEITDVTGEKCGLKSIPSSLPVPSELQAGIETTRLRLRDAGAESTGKNSEADKQGDKTVWLITSQI